MQDNMRVLEKWLERVGSQVNDFEIFLSGNRSGLNVLVFTEYVNATYFISFDIPLRLMHAEGHINLAVASQKHVEASGEGCWEQWASEFRPDVVVMTRYGQESGIKILECFKSRNVPLIYHIDDDLLDIPDSLGAEIRKRQGAERVVETRTYLLRNCDLIYASTTYLASLLQSRFPAQRVFHGIYAPYMGDSVSASTPRTSRNPVVGYMGSKGHQHDLDLVVPALERLLDEREDLAFEVFGTIKLPRKLEPFGSRVRSHSVQKSYLDFLSSLSSLSWDVGLAPLIDSAFNQCKAPTKYIEYTACGIPVAASNVSVYADVFPEGGGFLVDQDWYAPIVEILDNPERRKQTVMNAQHHCASSYSVPTLQRQLTDLFQTVKYREQL